MYFNASTQDAIIEYQNCECNIKREELYKDKIQNEFLTFDTILDFFGSSSKINDYLLKLKPKSKIYLFGVEDEKLFHRAPSEY